MSMGLIMAAGLLAQAAQDGAVSASPAPSAAPVEAAGESNVIAYPAAFFAESRPTSAYDMIQRLPGFSFSGGSNVRGFAGSAGNVLINGQRPTSKTVRLEDQLKQIPANTVLRIELIRGGAPGIDMQGQSLIANVVRNSTTTTTTAVTGGFRGYSDGWIGPRAALEWSRRGGALSLEGAASIEYIKSFNEGGPGDRRTFNPNGTLKEYADFDASRRGPQIAANLSGELNLGADIFRLNTGVTRNDEGGFDRYVRYNPTGTFLGLQSLNHTSREDSAELGGDYEHAFGNGITARILGLQTLDKNLFTDTSEQPGLTQKSDREQKSGESILRGTVEAQPWSNLTLEGGAEGVFNFLDAKSLITRNGAPVVLPNANVRVEERRAEAFLNSNWKPIDKLTVEANLRYETSRISQTGDTNSSRSFGFAKPRLLLSYAPDAASQIRLRVERTVGQLTFTDFAASAELAAGTAVAGNARLEPERAWVYEAVAERRFWGRGALVLTAQHQEVQAVVDRIPIQGLFDAPGNIGDGTRDQLGFNLTLPLDRLGIAGGRITSAVTWKWSKVTDPVTGRERRISGEAPVNGYVRFTQDVAALRSTYGVEVLQFSGANTQYRVNEIRRSSSDSYIYAYWDYKPDPTLSVRLEGRVITGREQRRYRTRFATNRAAGVVSEVEFFRYTIDPYISFTIRKVL